MDKVKDEEKPIILEGDDQLANEITTLAGQLNAGECRFLKLVGEFDQRLGWAGAGIRSCAHWLNWKCGIAMGAAREKVRSARVLAELPETNAAFEKGEISYSKVRAMTRVATPENENYFLMIAKHGTAQHMEQLVRKYKAVIRHNELEEPEREDRDQREFRDVYCYQEEDGMWNITARLPAEEGGLLVKALNAIVDRLDAPQDREKDVPAETFSEEPLSQEPMLKEEPPTMGQRRADALGALAEHFLAGSRSGKETGKDSGGDSDVGLEGNAGKGTLISLKGAERCQLILHVKSGFSIGMGAGISVGHGVGINAGISAGSSACGCGCDSEEKETDTLSHLDGHWVPPDVVKRLACDASFLLVEEDEAGNVLDIGRHSRIISPAMSRALAIRDGGCQFPGCCESRYVEGHHIIHWANGGETKMENLVTLCRYHHHELHRGSFFLTLKPAAQQAQAFADRLVFTKGTSGGVIARNPVNFTSTDCNFSALQGTLPESINAQTAVCHWRGEHMNYAMGVEGLLWADGWRD